MLQKWDVILAHCPFIHPPKKKLCITISREHLWFMFINTDPPPGRKAAQIAVVLESFDATFLKRRSHVDTTTIQHFSGGDREKCLLDAEASEDMRRGRLAIHVIQRIQTAVANHCQLTDAQRAVILEGS